MEDGRTASVVAVLEALSTEVHSLSKTAEGLQTILSSACVLHGADPEMRVKVQHCDLLTQKLDAISGFISSLAQTVPASCKIDISAVTQKITLSDLRNALSCDLRRNASSVDVEIF